MALGGDIRELLLLTKALHDTMIADHKVRTSGNKTELMIGTRKRATRLLSPSAAWLQIARRPSSP